MPNLHLCDLDLNKNQLLKAVVHTAGTAPATPEIGQIYYDTGDNTMYVCTAEAPGSGNTVGTWLDLGDNSGDITGVTITTDSGVGTKASDTAGSADFSMLGTSGVGVTNSGATITVTSVPGEIDHDSLQNFAANEHFTQANITTVGTIGTGVWNATAIAANKVATLNQDTTGTADKATHVLVSDNESANEANEITFVENAAAGGAQRGLESSAKATFNPSTGKITATGFVGALTGDASGSAGTVTSIGNLTGDVTSSNRATTIGSGVVHHAMLNDDIISGQGAVTALAQDDLLVVHDTSAGTVNKITYSNFEDDIFGNVDGDGTIAAGGALTITKSDGDFTVTGDLIVSGNTTTVNTANLLVEDPLIGLASGNGANSVDIGIWGKYTASGAKYTGLFRDASDSNIWKLFATTGNSHETPGTTTTINTSSGFTLGHLELDTIEATTLIIPDNAVAVGKIAAGALPSDVTINNGNWSGTDLAVANGGTGVSSLTAYKNLLDDETWTFANNITLSSGLVIGGHTVSDVDITSEASDADDHLMTALAVKNRIDDIVNARTKSYNLIVAAGTAVSGSVASNSDKTWTITHAMGNSLLYMVQVIRTANGSGETVFPCVTRTAATTVINFNVAPTSGDYTVVIVKI
jgi:hypothetical protein